MSASGSRYERKGHNMISKPLPVSVVYACLALATASFLVSPCSGDDLVKKHVAFARSLLNSPDDTIRATALEVVLASAPSDGLQLARKTLDGRAQKATDDSQEALRDLQDPARLAALHYLAGRADEECLRIVRELFAKNAHPKNMPRGYLNYVASYAADVLLQSNDQRARKQAIDWIEELLDDPDEVGVWEDAAYKVLKHHLSQLQARLTNNKIQGDQKVWAATFLAELGDEPSKRLIREKLTDVRWFSYIAHSLELVKVLGLSCKQIENALPSRADLERQHHEWKEKDSSVERFLAENDVTMARACAYLGHPEHLRALSQQMLDLSKLPRDSSKREKVLSILFAIKDVGDDSMIPVLEEFFVKVCLPAGDFYCPMHPHVVRLTLEPNGEMPKCPICGMRLAVRKNVQPDDSYRLDASWAIVEIISRRDVRNPVSK